jgi:hypothetical protein
MGSFVGIKKKARVYDLVRESEQAKGENRVSEHRFVLCR